MKSLIARFAFALLGTPLLVNSAYAQEQYQETTAYVDWLAGGNALSKRIEYVVSGPEDGDAILFIHGTAFADSFLPVMREEALGQYRKIRVHRLGYAGSAPLEYPVSLVEEAAAAVAVLDELGIERAHIAGHSAGGDVALNIAAYMPNRIRTVILAEGGPPALAVLRALVRAGTAPPLESQDQDPDMTALRGAMFRAVQAEDWETAVQSLSQLAIGENWREFVEAIPGSYEQAVADAPEYFRYEFGNVSKMLWEQYPLDLSIFSAPTLILWGEESQRWRDAIPFILETMADAEAVEILGADHGLITDDPEAVAKSISDFIARNP